MGRIRTPQSLSSLLSLIPRENSEYFLDLLNKYKVTDSKGRYHHWNEFQWHVDKEDDPKMAWLATKMARRVVSKQLKQLQAKDRSCFSYCIPIVCQKD